jgi:hypothetical protein
MSSPVAQIPQQQTPQVQTQAAATQSDTVFSAFPSVCYCRKMAGHTTGWCGRAGGGVPACDH